MSLILLLVMTLQVDGNYYFTSESCSYCKRQDKLILTLQEVGRFNIRVVQFEEEPEIFKEFGVTSTPTFIVIQNGEVSKLIGNQDIETLIELMNNDIYDFDRYDRGF